MQKHHLLKRLTHHVYVDEVFLELLHLPTVVDVLADFFRNMLIYSKVFQLISHSLIQIIVQVGLLVESGYQNGYLSEQNSRAE